MFLERHFPLIYNSWWRSNSSLGYQIIVSKNLFPKFWLSESLLRWLNCWRLLVPLTLLRVLLSLSVISRYLSIMLDFKIKFSFRFQFYVYCVSEVYILIFICNICSSLCLTLMTLIFEWLWCTVISYWSVPI